MGDDIRRSDGQADGPPRLPAAESGPASHVPHAITGAILAGGASSRFGGRPKGLEMVGGERVIDRLARCLREALGCSPVLIANASDADSWETGLRIVPDILPGYGALGGIYSAVAAAPAPVVAVAWDMPFVNASLVRLLADALGEPYDAVLPASAGRRGVEPLCAAYGPACEPAIRSALERGDRRAIAFHDAVSVCVLPTDRVAQAGDPELLFFNINTADDLAQAESRWQRALSPS